jgi:hypothetical protein
LFKQRAVGYESRTESVTWASPSRGATGTGRAKPQDSTDTNKLTLATHWITPQTINMGCWVLTCGVCQYKMLLWYLRWVRRGGQQYGQLGRHSGHELSPTYCGNNYRTSNSPLLFAARSNRSFSSHIHSHSALSTYPLPL